MRIRQVAATAAASVLVGLSAVVMAGSPSAAAGIDASCTLGSDSYSFSPALGLTAKTTTFTGSGVNASTCAVAPAGITTVALSSVSGSGQMSCLTSSGVTGTAVFTWSDATTSTVALNGLALGTSSVAKVVTLGGTVTSGRFVGDTVALVYLSTANTALCLTDSLATIPGTVTTLTFVDPT